MKRLLSVIVVTLVPLSASAQSASGPPAKTLESLGTTIENDDLRGKWTLFARTQISKKNGKTVQTEETLMEIDHSDEQTDTKLIRYTKDGEDKTKERREELEKRQKEVDEKNEGDDDGGSFSLDFGMTFPTAENRDRYEFSEVSEEDGYAVVSFEPRESNPEDADKLVKGRLAWDPRTLDPAFIEIRPYENPKYIDELWMKNEFERVHGRLLLKRNHTKGLGGVLLIKRRFDVLVEVRDYEPPRTVGTE